MKEMETEMVKYPNKLTKPTKRWIRLRYYPPLLQWQSKKRDQNEILVSQIHEIRLGMNTLGFSLYEKSPALEERAFSVIYLQQGKFKFLNLLAQNQEETLKWVNTLHQLMSLDYQISDFDTWLTRIWDNEHKQFMNVDEITLVFKRLNLNLSKREVKSAFKFSNLGKQGQMCYSDFEKLYKSLRYRPEIAQLFSSLAQDSPLCISFDEFYRFLKRDQRVSWTLERSKEMFGKFSDQNRMSIDHFTAFLMSTRNSIFKKEHLHTHQDMTHPLAHYYINSSHNTYLLGDQVAGYSSVEGYIRALQRGCKCVEIDVWDGPNQMPLVYHGRTLTSKITFKEVMEAIAKYAFCVSQMPLILSIEVRCSAETQNHMAKLMRDILGDMLLAAPLDNVTDPSPWDLRGKILVKANTYRLGDDDEEEPKRRLSPPMMSRSRSRNGSSLTSLIIYLRGVSFKDNLEPGDMISVNDRKIQQLETKLFPELVQSNIVRVYPSLIHFTSSNFDPIHHWLRGTQMVALNFQTDGTCTDTRQSHGSQSSPVQIEW
ncbi:PLC-like phosphodiesterase [Gorgonomyces haynaldii]|nr:PLC-like phosphodiesterase [Gorgonomyces haynaldii]